MRINSDMFSLVLSWYLAPLSPLAYVTTFLNSYCGFDRFVGNSYLIIWYFRQGKWRKIWSQITRIFNVVVMSFHAFFKKLYMIMIFILVSNKIYSSTRKGLKGVLKFVVLARHMSLDEFYIRSYASGKNTEFSLSLWFCLRCVFFELILFI